MGKCKEEREREKGGGGGGGGEGGRGLVAGFSFVPKLSQSILQRIASNTGVDHSICQSINQSFRASWCFVSKIRSTAILKKQAACRIDH